MDYRLLILSDPDEDFQLPEDTSRCFSFVSAVVSRHFRKMSHVALTVGNSRKDLHLLSCDWDFVLAIDYSCHCDKIRSMWGGKMLTLLEVPCREADWSFTFTPWGSPRETTVGFPFAREVMEVKPKEKVIVVDHQWIPLGPGQQDWTLRVSDWLSPLVGRYRIVRMVHFGGEEKTVKPHESVLANCKMGEYLDATSTAETFVCTHTESYGFGVVDMLSRGIRVVAPVGLLRRPLVDYFEIPEFSTRDEFLSLVSRPLEDRWSTMVEKCVDYSAVVGIIDRKCQEMMGQT